MAKDSFDWFISIRMLLVCLELVLIPFLFLLIEVSLLASIGYLIGVALIIVLSSCLLKKLLDCPWFLTIWLSMWIPVILVCVLFLWLTGWHFLYLIIFAWIGFEVFQAYNQIRARRKRNNQNPIGVRRKRNNQNPIGVRRKRNNQNQIAKS